MENKITISILKDNGHCYACQAINYDSSLLLVTKRVDKLYHISMIDTFGFTLLLCKDCISELQEDISEVINNNEL